ncbi:hypothetical protein [Rubritalea tangerina]|uniref:hypothetical protein n=1 Tax=Rubritalea tangerina TaxID=430798 RepID=UPI00361BD117
MCGSLEYHAGAAWVVEFDEPGFDGDFLGVANIFGGGGPTDAKHIADGGVSGWTGFFLIG